MTYQNRHSSAPDPLFIIYLILHATTKHQRASPATQPASGTVCRVYAYGMGLLDRVFNKPAENKGKFGFCVVGLGQIAEPFLDQVRGSSTCRVTAVVSGSDAKVAAVRKKNQNVASYTYAEFDHIAANPDIDAVYLALPVSLHRAYTERAAAAGKHVLCEKPMASTAVDAEAMIAACRAANVRLGVAYRCPHTYAHKKLRDLLQTGAFGPKSSLRLASGFGFKLKPGWRDDASLGGGGSLWDVGIYPLNAARFLLGEEPVGVEDASAVTDARGLEREVRWTSVFPSGARAACSSSYDRNIPDTLRVSGELGSALMDPAYRWQKPYRLHASLHTLSFNKERELTERGYDELEFRLEAEELAAAVREGRDTICPGEDGLADLQAMEAIYRAAGVPYRS